jgi:tRNA-dihydrouridine synthase
VLATELGSPGIDINFGCPARRVNNSCGGAALLKDPESIYRILRTVRDALPAEQLLSAKVRLGWSLPDECHEIIDAVLQGGAGELAIHARTKEDGYKAEAIKWEWINTLRPKLIFR